MSNLKELQQVLRDAERELRSLENIRNKEKDEKISAIKEQVDAAYSERLSILRAAVSKASGDELAERDRIAKEGGGFPYKNGDRFVEVVQKYHFHKMRKTGVIGVFEIITKDSKLPDNMRWNRPEVGDPVIRLLKKDGTPGLKVEKFNYYSGEMKLPHGWYQEGFEPAEVKST